MDDDKLRVLHGRRVGVKQDISTRLLFDLLKWKLTSYRSETLSYVYNPSEQRRIIKLFIWSVTFFVDVNLLKSKTWVQVVLSDIAHVIYFSFERSIAHGC